MTETEHPHCLAALAVLHSESKSMSHFQMTPWAELGQCPSLLFKDASALPKETLSCLAVDSVFYEPQ